MVDAPLNSPYYMSREYIKNFGNLVLVLFDYILVHVRMLDKYTLGLESMSFTWVEKSLHINLFEHEIGRIEILHFDPMIEHGKEGSPCRRSFNFITHIYISK